ncbi:hypothetical protein IHQ56_18680, partial [Methylobacillus flagellatus]|uniref:hypothetical protein n=1 Tax=Methylobacillus flagellatus TaxID=405 RepID=UPI002853AF62
MTSTTTTSNGTDRISLKLVEKAGFLDFVMVHFADLPGAASRLALFLARNTIGMGRKTLDATWPQLERGERASNDTLYSWLRRPIGLSRSTFFAALAHLKTIDLIRVTHTDRNVPLFEINPDWRPAADEMSIAEYVSYYSRRHQAENDRPKTRTPSVDDCPENRTPYNVWPNAITKNKRRQEAKELRSSPVGSDFQEKNSQREGSSIPSTVASRPAEERSSPEIARAPL